MGRVLRGRRQPRADGADFFVGGRRYGLFAHDFRRVPVDVLLERITERALAQDIMPSPAAIKPPLLVLSQTEFDDSVRQALRDLRRPDLLARNPLLRTRSRMTAPETTSRAQRP